MNRLRLEHPDTKDVVISDDFYAVMKLLDCGYKVIPKRGGCGGRPTRAQSRRNAVVKRAHQMHQYYRDGHTLEEVGEKWGITRQRVQQIFTNHGLSSRK